MRFQKMVPLAIRSLFQILASRAVFPSLPLLIPFFLLSSCDNGPHPVFVDLDQAIRMEKPLSRAPATPPLRVAVAAMISPKETFSAYGRLLDYIGRKTGRETAFIQRKTYQEISELLGKGSIDIAFVCSGPYASGKGKFGFELLAVPQVQGKSDYHSYLIVKDRAFQTLEDLRGKVFAFTDPESNTGRLVPSHWLALQGERPEKFFGKILYTYSHDNSIQAVARGLADGAAVDSLIWEYYRDRNPELTASISVIKRSEPYPIPPVVASRELSKEDADRIRQSLLTIHQDPEGRTILHQLRVDRFILAPSAWHENMVHIEKMLAFMEEKHRGVEKP
jgi:phosphonate transport system substrate-binding protein